MNGKRDHFTTLEIDRPGDRADSIKALIDTNIIVRQETSRIQWQMIETHTFSFFYSLGRAFQNRNRRLTLFAGNTQHC